MNVLRRVLASMVAWAPIAALAEQSMPQTQTAVGGAGASGLWVLANICFAGMRAQNSPSTGWRMISFIFGFPGTFLTWLVVEEGSERAYGVDIPKKR